MNKKWLWIAPLAIAGLALFIAIGGQVVMYLWNAILPELFGWKTITFWQALGLLALCRILFGGFGGGHGHGRKRCKHRGFAGRCEELTPEERERIGQRFRPDPAAGA